MSRFTYICFIIAAPSEQLPFLPSSSTTNITFLEINIREEKKKKFSKRNLSLIHISPPCTNSSGQRSTVLDGSSYQVTGQIKSIAIARRRTHSFLLPPPRTNERRSYEIPKDTPFRHYEVLNPCCAFLLRTRRNRPTRGK